MSAEFALSVVVPFCNEVDSVRPLHAALAQALSRLRQSTEMVFVDDGSRDGTWEALGALRAGDPRVGAIRLKRNFGQTEELGCRVLGVRKGSW